jgi:SAM-dependent methyltransferase
MTETPTTEIALEQRQADAARLFSPSAARNRDAIGDLLAAVLPQGARVLEIGSGTGEHAVAVCMRRPDIVWQPSDPDARSRASQNAWAAEAAPNMLPALDLDLTRAGRDAALGRFDALVCLNVIHIAPWAVAEAIAGASVTCVEPGGLIYLYGPYLEGEATAPSNLEFDRSLKSRNPQWGVRTRSDVEALFAAAGWAKPERHEMPANNLSLVFRHRSST